MLAEQFDDALQIFGADGARGEIGLGEFADLLERLIESGAAVVVENGAVRAGGGQELNKLRRFSGGGPTSAAHARTLDRP
jgi:hypothetical protein